MAANPCRGPLKRIPKCAVLTQGGKDADSRGARMQVGVVEARRIKRSTCRQATARKPPPPPPAACRHWWLPTSAPATETPSSPLPSCGGYWRTCPAGSRCAAVLTTAVHRCCCCCCWPSAAGIAAAAETPGITLLLSRDPPTLLWKQRASDAKDLLQLLPRRLRQRRHRLLPLRPQLLLVCLRAGAGEQKNFFYTI